MSQLRSKALATRNRRDRPRGSNQALHWKRGLDTEYEEPLGKVLKQLTGTQEQLTNFGFRLCRADALCDPLMATLAPQYAPPSSPEAS